MRRKSFFNKDNFQFIVILGLFAYILTLKQCEQQGSSSEQYPSRIDTIVRIDTTAAAPIVIRMPRQAVPKPIVIYVDSSGQRLPTAKIDTQVHEKAQLYQDSIADENLTLYYESTIKGQLLNNVLDYKLKVPKRITKTIEISKPYPMPVSTMLLTGGIGGNINQFSSITVGLQFVSAKGWALGYDYDVLQKAHHVKLGIKLFQFKNKR
ncbi:hypothetical protein [Aureispira anguillae]|uniref:Uncharacterized protein n=1 Tax=Aureispira anguillae TaxID=2864201 RepID=A0A915YH49_9BACT|nr:hypothetical protein [Aureispira anguillae]BDS13064.1 hypothetical protein AsAng_0037920 [Aureispira anguillae]